MSRHYLKDFAPDVILIDATHAIVDEATFAELDGYNCSLPTNPSVGRCWKRDEREHGGTAVMFAWTENDPRPGVVRIRWRELLVVEKAGEK